ncbi:putative acetyl-CoA C-acyltransferase [Helianthus annuus]|nr:putative acetyl-CoA C-acyltransferase [Helianthus annuus]
MRHEQNQVTLDYHRKVVVALPTRRFKGEIIPIKTKMLTRKLKDGIRPGTLQLKKSSYNFY